MHSFFSHIFWSLSDLRQLYPAPVLVLKVYNKDAFTPGGYLSLQVELHLLIEKIVFELYSKHMQLSLNLVTFKDQI